MSHAANYAANHAAILRDLGRSQAEAKLRAGAGWAQAIGEVGQAVAGIPGQLQQQKQADQQSQILARNLAQLAKQDQRDQWLADAMNSSVVNGQIDERRLTENLSLMGAAELVPDAVKVIRESSYALQQLKNAQQQGQINEAELRGMALDYFKPFAKAIKEANFDPGVVNGALSVVALQAGQDEADRLRQSFATDPNALTMMVDSVLVPEKEKPSVTVAKDAGLWNPNTGTWDVERPTQPEPVGSLDDQLAAAFKAGDRATVNAIVKLQAEIAAGKRAPERAGAPNYQKVETVDAAGNPVTTFMTAEEVRAQGGIRTSPKTTAKASGPATVDAILGEIEGLSKKINTSSGGPMSNVTGAVRRGAAAGNMDNDVSEYQALVEGFIPMVARAVGHTGVLTQQDVDSVRALFPKPGDNAQLSKNKLERVKRIMKQVQSPEAPAGRASGAGPTKGGGADPLGIRPGGGGL